MRTAFEKAFNVITLTDCTATTSKEGQKAAVEGTYGMFSTPMSAAEFMIKIEAVRHNETEEEVTAALEEGAKEGENAVQHATESDLKDGKETLEPNEDSMVDKKDTTDMLKKAIDAGEGEMNVDPDEGEAGPSATEARHVCCW
jgi:hypothetical protein